MKQARRVCSEILITLALLLPLTAMGTDDAVQRLQADFILGAEPSAPPDSAPWQPVTLPDDRQTRRPGWVL